MKKVVNFRLPAPVFTLVKANTKGPMSVCAETLLREFVEGKVEVTNRPPPAHVSTSVSIDDATLQRAKEKAEHLGLSIHYVVARLLEMEANGELHRT